MADISAVHPQALSERSWLVRVPGLRSLTRHAAWWNPLWVETFELVTANRAEVCEDLLNAALPSLPEFPAADGCGDTCGKAASR
jgi:hypothetical protein